MPCSTCTHLKPGETDKHYPRMFRAGFALCALAPRWRFMAPAATCERFREASPRALAARVAWPGMADER